jgi:hypothetical protein
MATEGGASGNQAEGDTATSGGMVTIRRTASIVIITINITIDN